MAHTKQAKKRIRQNARQQARNRSRMNRVRTAVKAVEEGAAKGEGVDVGKLYRKAASELDRAAKRNIIHKNAAARKKSRLAKQVARAKA